MESESIKPWKRKKVKQIADCRVFKVCESASLSPSTAKEHPFFFIESDDWVNVVPVTPANEVVCIRQFRHGSEKISLEIPGGLVDPGEDPIAAASPRDDQRCRLKAASRRTQRRTRSEV